MAHLNSVPYLKKPIPMEELLAQLKEKAGLNDEQAMQAVVIMKDFVMSKVPPMFSGFVENFFADTKTDGADSFLH